MGLIDSINRFSRASVSAKQEQRQERKQAQADKRELAGAKALAVEELTAYIEGVYERIGYVQANAYFKIIEARERTINALATDELTRQELAKNYYTTLAKVGKIYKADAEADKPPTPAQARAGAEASAAVAVARLVLAIGRTLAGAFVLVILAVAGFINLSAKVCTPTRARRYR